MAQGSALSLRQGDSLAFTRAANALEQAAKNGDRTAREQALKRNQLLWTQVQRLLVPDSHPMPAKLRADMLSLSLFVDRQTVKALVSGEAEDMLALVDIDRQVAAGLLE
ncbi:MAG: flagellar biosynthesis regulator FlaF [Magnetospirillum sp.]